MLFKAKKVFWNKWLLWIAMVIAIILFFYNHRYTAIGIAVGVVLCLAYIFRNNYFFYVSENELICKGGVFFKRIKLKSITGLRLSRHPFFILSPFKSLLRVKIRYYQENGKIAHYTISPQRREEFFKILLDKCLEKY